MHHIPVSAHTLAKHNKTGRDMEDSAKNVLHRKLFSFISSYCRKSYFENAILTLTDQV